MTKDHKDDAIKLYQRLVTEFSDIDPDARLSRENLTALAAKEPAPTAAPAALPAVSGAEAEALARESPHPRHQKWRRPGGPRNLFRSSPNHTTSNSTTAPPTMRSAWSLGGCIPMTMRKRQPSTETTASGR